MNRKALVIDDNVNGSSLEARHLVENDAGHVVELFVQEDAEMPDGTRVHLLLDLDDARELADFILMTLRKHQ